MRSWLACILAFVVCVPLLAQTAAKSQTSTSTNTTTTTTKKATKKRAPAKKAPTAASEMKTLRDAVNAQQQQIQMLRDELARRDAAMQQVQSQLNSLQSTATQAQSTAQAAESTGKENQDQLATLKTNLGTVQTSATATANSLQATEKRVGSLESPLAIKFKGITLTPGGFVAAQLNWRDHNQNLDNFGNFGALPFNGTSNANLTELRLTARYTRISLLGQGKLGRANVQGYYEMDFEGAAPTANENQTNSFQPRIRELWANVDGPGGISFTGGQTWSLITANRTGVGPRGLALPSHISASLIVGFHYTRQNGFRVYKTFEMANKRKAYIAFSVENPETTSAGTAPGGLTLFGLQGAASGNNGGSGTNCTVATPCSTIATNTSIDAAPDLIAKVAFEPGWGHFELAGIGRFFRDRVALTSATGQPSVGTNHITHSGGVSFNAVLPVVPKRVDVVLSTLAGRGIGRYSTTGVPDVTFRPDGTLMPVLSYQGSVGIETHPHPKLDVNVYLGNEYTQRTQYFVAGVANPVTGYGLITSNISGCGIELPTAAQGCTPFNRDNWEVSPGFWYRFYKGPAGTVQFGTYFSHYRRNLWTGTISPTGAAVVRGAPKADLNEVLTAFRWYLP